MRIMEIISCTQINGAARHCVMLSRELSRRGHEVTLLCPPGAWIAGQLAADPVRVMFSDMRRFPPGELRRVAAEIRRRRIEVVHTHMSRANLFGVLLRWFAGVPSIATAHARHFQPHWMFNDLVIAVSDATRRYHRRVNLVPSGRILTVRNFVAENPAAEPATGVRRQVRAALGVPEETLLLGIVGSLFPPKGHVYLIRALPEVIAAVGDVRLAVVGSEIPLKHVEMLREEARWLGVAEHILWLGSRNDVPQLMSALDVCVGASLKETLSQVALEAMAAGVAVVGTAVGGVPECVVAGETGLLVPPRDSGALARALIGLLGDPLRLRAFGAAGLRRAGEHFSAEKYLASFEAAVRQVTRGRQSDLKSPE
jgi:glycosyltransferase involved in cell wall biosynthesis